MHLDPYAVLGVPRDADLARIRTAWKRIARESHPDRNPGDSQAERRFKDAAAAWALLSDPQARARWDRGERRGPTRGPQAEALRRTAALTRQAVEDVAQVLFQRVLPAFLQRYERGLGAEATWQLLRAIDDLTLLQITLDEGPPGFAARQRAGALRERLRLRLDPRVREGLDGELQLCSLTLVQDRGLRWAAITTWVGSVHLRGLDDPDALQVTLLPALATEVVRAMEADLPEDLRVLAWRHRTGRQGFPAAFETARRRDTRAQIVVGLRITLGVACLAIAGWALMWALTGRMPGLE